MVKTNTIVVATNIYEDSADIATINVTNMDTIIKRYTNKKIKELTKEIENDRVLMSNIGVGLCGGYNILYPSYLVQEQDLRTLSYIPITYIDGMSIFSLLRILILYAAKVKTKDGDVVNLDTLDVSPNSLSIFIPYLKHFSDNKYYWTRLNLLYQKSNGDYAGIEDVEFMVPKSILNDIDFKDFMDCIEILEDTVYLDVSYTTFKFTYSDYGVFDSMPIVTPLVSGLLNTSLIEMIEIFRGISKAKKKYLGSFMSNDKEIIRDVVTDKEYYDKEYRDNISITFADTLRKSSEKYYNSFLQSVNTGSYMMGPYTVINEYTKVYHKHMISLYIEYNENKNLLDSLYSREKTMLSFINLMQLEIRFNFMYFYNPLYKLFKKECQLSVSKHGLVTDSYKMGE